MLKVLFESLQRLKFEVLLDWLMERNCFNKYVEFMESDSITKLIKERSPANLETCSLHFRSLFEAIEEFDGKLCDGTFGSMACYWQSFIHMVQILLDFIKSIRIGDWSLHLSSMRRMLPWFHAYDRTNYARHFSYCWAAQSQLESTHPSIYQKFQNGEFSTNRTPGNFNLLPPDQVIEQTINKEQKGPGGIIGFSTSEGSLQRWVLSSHVYATISSDFKESIGFNQENRKPKDLQETRMQFDEKQIKSALETFNLWSHPFKECESLVSCSSEVVADKETEADLLNAHAKGEECFTRFMKERVYSNEVKFDHQIENI